MQTIQEMTEALIYAGTKKGLKFPTRTNETEEIFLSKVKELCEESGVKLKESKPIVRNNGGRQNFSEADTNSRDERLLCYMGESYRMNYREALYMLGETPGRDAKPPASLIEAIVAKWKEYSPWISDQDARKLAEMGKLP
jgi:hypothetical protein